MYFYNGRINTMKIKLQNIANIISGINHDYRKRIPPGEKIAYLQAKDFNEKGIIKDNIIKISGNSIYDKLLIKNKDVLFVAKGTRKYSVIYKGEVGHAVAASTFFIIRITDKNILPEYISWYLNQKPAQDYIKQQSAGTNTPLISKKQLSEMEIPVPSFVMQLKVMDIARLRSKEKELINEINFKKDLLIENILLKKITETE
jgi:restriction endonuclease S subunit